MDIIIFDFEIFKYNSLLGVKQLSDGKIIQLWDIKEMRQYFIDHVNDLWVGHNNDAYDNHLIRGILDGMSTEQELYSLSKSIVNSNGFRGKVELPMYTYDLMCCRFYSLKMTELLIGKNIHTTDVSFDLDRPLTQEEIDLTNDYNKDDLLQTEHNFHELKDPMLLRLRLLKEFNINKRYLTATEAKLATLALGAKQIPGIEHMYMPPKIYDTLQVKNEAVLDFYKREGFRNGEKLTVTLCGVEHQLGAGGIHAAIKKCHDTDFIYLDVSGYYNLVMINYDLLPRTIPQKGKQLYEYMYHEQLKLKGVDDDKRWVYKTILLSVFGASINKYTDFYDPQVGTLITITGQMFLVDLLEKLEGKVKLLQSNTDGIMVKPLPTSSKEEVLQIVKDWCTRTGFVIKPKFIKELWQRDVNCYCYIDDSGHDGVKGDAFVGAWATDEPVKSALYEAKDAPIVTKAVYEFFVKGILPEKTIEANKDNLLMYQYLCKKGTYDYCTYEETNDDGTKVENIGGLNRAFARKNDCTVGMIYKHKTRNGQIARTKLPNVPDNLFIYNYDIRTDDIKQKLTEKIDFDYYVQKAYKFINAFLPVPTIGAILK